jgi:hypothetical protein
MLPIPHTAYLMQLSVSAVFLKLARPSPALLTFKARTDYLELAPFESLMSYGAH